MKDFVPLKPCPSCGSTLMNDRFVYIECSMCLMTGPKENNGRHDEHSDFVDHERAIEKWNALPRDKKRSK